MTSLNREKSRVTRLLHESQLSAIGPRRPAWSRLGDGDTCVESKPSDQMLVAIARGLRLTLDERDDLFRLPGHNAPMRLRTDHVSPGMMRVLDHLDDTPAQIITELGEILVQTRLARALLGDPSHYRGKARSVIYRWFTDREARRICPEDDHPCTAAPLPQTCVAQ